MPMSEPAPIAPAPASAPGPSGPKQARRLSAHLRRWVTLRDQPSRLGAALAGLACVLLVLLAWHVLTLGEPESRILAPVTLPSLRETVDSFPKLWFDRQLARSAVWSLGRVLGGFVLAIAIGVPLGVIAGSFKRVYAFLNPLSIFGRNIPIAALIVLMLIWFGIGEAQKVMFIFLAAVPFVFFNSANAVDSVPDTYLDTAYTLGARFTPLRGLRWAALMAVAYGVLLRLAHVAMEGFPPVAEAGGEVSTSWRSGLAKAVGIGLVAGFVLWFPIVSFQAIRKVLFALALPDIMNSLRLLFGLAFGYIVLAEAIDAQHGLGAIILTSQRQGPREHIYLVLIIIAILAYGIDRGLLWAHGWLFPYRATGEK